MVCNRENLKLPELGKYTYLQTRCKKKLSLLINAIVIWMKVLKTFFYN